MPLMKLAPQQQIFLTMNGLDAADMDAQLLGAWTLSEPEALLVYF